MLCLFQRSQILTRHYARFACLLILSHPPISVRRVCDPHDVAFVHGQFRLVFGQKIICRLIQSTLDNKYIQNQTRNASILNCQTYLLWHVFEKNLLRTAYRRRTIIIDQLIERVKRPCPNIIFVIAEKYFKMLHQFIISKTIDADEK